jgi:hypothetical protein
LRVINVWAYVKTGAIYAAAFGLLIFGLGFISWSFGSACPPTCPPVPLDEPCALAHGALPVIDHHGNEHHAPRSVLGGKLPDY